MRKALVLTERGRLLAGLLAAFGGEDLEVVIAATAVEAGKRLRTERIDLLVVDFAKLPADERRQVASLRASGSETSLLAIVPAERPRLLREALRADPDGLLLDPFDLAEGEQVVTKLLASRGSALSGHESLDALATFLKGLAHEILNPLMSVSGILQLLRKDAAATPELTARYEAMWQGSERIHKTVRELEYFVKTKKPQRSRFDPARFVRELEEQWKSGDAPLGKSGDAPLAVSVRAPATAPAVLGDAEQLATALRHLVRFAAGADGRGEVALELEVASDRIEVAIRGSSAVKLPKRPADLLIPYQDVRGTGRSGSLELAAAYGIFRSHKGTIEVTSTPGGGVRFLALLPLPPAIGGEADASATGSG
jgi:signal transduction histidine kinase